MAKTRRSRRNQQATRWRRLLTRARQMPSKLRRRWPQTRRRWARLPWRGIAVGVTLVFAALIALSLALPAESAFTRETARLLRRLLGWAAYLLPVALAIAALSTHARARWASAGRIAGGTLVLLAALATTHLAQRLQNPFVISVAGFGGGWVGWTVSSALARALGRVGAYCILLGVGLVGLLLLVDPGRRQLPARLEAAVARLRNATTAHPVTPAVPATKRRRTQPPHELARPEKPEPPVSADPVAVAAARPEERHEPPEPRRVPRPASPPASALGQSPAGDDLAQAAAAPTAGWGLPDVAAIFSQREDESAGDDLVDERARIIEDTLDALGVPAEVVEAQRGPAVTQFAVRPGTIERRGIDGRLRPMRVRVSKISSLADDLALALSASPVRIQAPIPGRSVVGVEVPNPQARVVPLGCVLASDDFQALATSPLALALGRDISGRSLVADLAKMPHLLMAGSTGSGKSVGINSIIATLLARNTPGSLRLVLIDPKRVELSGYNGLPHVIGKVVSNAEEAVAALKWATREMDRRLAAFADVGARDIRGYNSRVERQGNAPLPRVVVIIDELADLMMSAPYDVEHTLCRLAQMARATGIHLIVATQRPSVDVLTGLVKANFPARIAFAVSTMVDSRVIIDAPGAERLLGRGDMLFMSPTGMRLTRAQGCWVSDGEIAALVRYWRQSDASAPSDGPFVQGTLWPEAGALKHEDEVDTLLNQAIDIVRKEGRASTTMLQRHLRIGYNRASRLVDTLVAQGVISSQADARHGSRSVVVADEAPSPDEGPDGDAAPVPEPEE